MSAKNALKLDLSANQETKIQQLEDELRYWESFGDWVELMSAKGETYLTEERFSAEVDSGEWVID